MATSSAEILLKYHAALVIAFMVGILALLESPLAVAANGDWVEFHSANLPPSPLKIRQAKKKGIELKAVPGTLIGGYLFLPEATGSHPAIILTHDCRGVRAFHLEWARKFVQWGYAALIIDSYKPRQAEVDKICKNLNEWDMREEISGRVFDVFGALEFLVTIPSVDADRIGLIGWDRGNLSAVAREGAQKHFENKIRAAVGMSQDCRSTVSGELIAPVLILTGDLNDWWPPFSCERMKKNAVVSGSSVEVVIYDEVLHSFDDPDVGEITFLEDAFNHNKSPAIGATLGYNENAHLNATNRVQKYFAKHFK